MSKCIFLHGHRYIASAWSVLIFSGTVLAEDSSPAPSPSPVVLESSEPAANPTEQLNSPLLTKSVTLLFRIRTKGAGRALRKAEVKQGDKIFYSDDRGEVTADILLDDSPVQIARTGYLTETFKPDGISSGSLVEVFLYPAQPSDNEVLVQGSRRPEVSRKSISVTEAARVAASGDPAQVTKLLPGVQSRPINPKIVVRGSGPNDSGYYIDDVEVPELYHRIGSISILPDLLISDVEFSSGGFGPQYGDKHGGIVALKTRNEIPEHSISEFRVNIPILSTIYHEQPVGNDQSFAISLRRSYVDVFVKEIVEKQGNGLTLLPSFGDGHFRYLKKTETGHHKLLVLGSYDQLKVAAPLNAAASDDGRGRFSTRQDVGILSYENLSSLGSGWTLSTTPYIFRDIEKTDVLDNHGYANVTAMRLRSEARKRRSKDESTFVGFEFTNINAKIDVFAPQPRQDDPFYDFEDAEKRSISRESSHNDVAMWVAHDFKLANTVLSPGVRAFHNGQIDEAGFDPRLSMRMFLSDEHLLKGAVGQYSEKPEFSEGTKKSEFGNPDLEFERCNHYILGHEWKISERWESDVQVFQKVFPNLIQPAGGGDNFLNSGERISKGFELFLRRNPTDRAFGWLSYTYFQSKERATKEQEYHPGQYNQTHVLHLAGNYRITGQWETGGTLSYHTGDTRTPVDSAVYNSGLDKYQPRFATDSQYSARMPDYHEVDLYGAYDFLYDLWKLRFRFGVQYLALEQQALSVQYNYDYSKEEYFRSLPPIPYLELRGIF